MSKIHPKLLDRQQENVIYNHEKRQLVEIKSEKSQMLDLGYKIYVIPWWYNTDYAHNEWTSRKAQRMKKSWKIHN